MHLISLFKSFFSFFQLKQGGGEVKGAGGGGGQKKKKILGNNCSFALVTQ